MSEHLATDTQVDTQARIVIPQEHVEAAARLWGIDWEAFVRVEQDDYSLRPDTTNADLILEKITEANQRGWSVCINFNSVAALPDNSAYRVVSAMAPHDAPNRITAAMFHLAYVAPEIWRDVTDNPVIHDKSQGDVTDE